jgi:hypothetical protein
MFHFFEAKRFLDARSGAFSQPKKESDVRDHQHRKVISGTNSTAQNVRSACHSTPYVASTF